MICGECLQTSDSLWANWIALRLAAGHRFCGSASLQREGNRLLSRAGAQGPTRQPPPPSSHAHAREEHTHVTAGSAHAAWEGLSVSLRMCVTATKTGRGSLHQLKTPTDCVFLKLYNRNSALIYTFSSHLIDRCAKPSGLPT